MNRAIVCLGSNVHGGKLLVKKSCVEIRGLVSSAKFSSCYETVPVSSIPQPNYHNCVGVLETELEFEDYFVFLRKWKRLPDVLRAVKK